MKERIHQKANDLFRRYGVKSITMDEIASQLGVSKKTIYQYYSDKDELVDDVVNSIIAFSRGVCEKNRETSKDAIHELFQVQGIVREIFSGMNPVMMYDLERFHPSSYRIFLNYKNNYLFNIIHSNLERGIEEGLYRPEINKEVVTLFRLEGMSIAFNQDIYPATRFNLAEIQKEIIELFLFGVASLKGYKLILKYQQERSKS